ncbi:urease accessory protein UreF [Rhodovulum imhoffii]|nr:urease accessory UreF family protein [Rhodovulum imhoffii]
MATTTDTELLTLAQWFSPACPIGAFSYSHGLEWAIDAGDVADAATLRTWISDILLHGTGKSDAVFLAAAYRARDTRRLAGIDAACRAFAPGRERLLETELQGAAFCRVTEQVWGKRLGNLAYPVAVGHAASLFGLPQIATASMYLHAFASTLASVGMRLIPIGQTEGQRVIRDVAPLCRTVAETTAPGDLETLSGTAFLADIAALRHETQHSRIFRT